VPIPSLNSLLDRILLGTDILPGAEPNGRNLRSSVELAFCTSHDEYSRVDMTDKLANFITFLLSSALYYYIKQACTSG
jgi:hypothetical protein